MTITFKNLTEARNYLTENGYRFLRNGGQYGNRNRFAEVYEAGPLVAILTKVPFKGVKVSVH